MRFAISVVLLAGVLCFIPGIFAHAPLALTIDPHRSLLIMEPKIVNPGKMGGHCNLQPASDTWSFASLMTNIAGGNWLQGKELILNWLAQFETTQTLGNGEAAQPRPGVGDKITKQWAHAHYAADELPFRLLAIVNRVDLRDSPLISGENGGELRFVFGAVAPDCSDLPFGVILEFGVRVGDCDGLAGWADGWISLSGIDPVKQTVAYVTKLKSLVDPRLAAKAVSGKPNGSALDHLRTNENLAAGGKPELREFRLSPSTHRLMQDSVTLTPADDLNATPALATFLNRIANGISGLDYWVPLFQPGTVNAPLQGAAASPHLVQSGQDFWHASGVQADIGTFSGNTCSGCHSFPDANPDFTHVDPAPSGHKTGYGRASAFLTNDVQQNRCPLLCRASAATDGARDHADNACWPPQAAPSAMCQQACGISMTKVPKRALVH